MTANTHLQDRSLSKRICTLPRLGCGLLARLAVVGAVSAFASCYAIAVAQERAKQDKELEVLKQRLRDLEQRLAEQKGKRVHEAQAANAIQQARLQRLGQVREWGLAQFKDFELNLPERVRADRPTQYVYQIERWKNAHARLKDKFTNLPEQSRGEIASGRALNFFLDTYGSTAIMHALARTKGDESFDDLLQSLATETELGPDVLRHVRFTIGLTGRKVTGQLTTGALPLDWPSALVTGRRYDEYKMLLKESRDRAMEELKAGKGISPETQEELMLIATSFYDAFHADLREFLKTHAKYDDDCRAPVRGETIPGVVANGSVPIRRGPGALRCRRHSVPTRHGRGTSRTHEQQRAPFRASWRE